MESNNQYKQSESEGNVRAPTPAQVTTRTPVDIKISKLEDQVADQQRSILKLTREIARLKNDISDIIEVVNNRG